ncbi:DUF4250 domain-containing protein [Lachnospiraceae bacterium 62-35]
MKNIPKDPLILLSWMNTQLRDYYGTLDELCQALELNKEEICVRLSEEGFEYDEQVSQFL